QLALQLMFTCFCISVFLPSVLDMCGGVLTGLSGVISSPGYPHEYSNNADCSWAIRVSNNSVVTLVFLDFQLENNEGCHFDFVALFDGPTVTHRHLGKYCGAERPPNTVTSSNHLLVMFKSDFNIGGRGFKAYYYSERPQTRHKKYHLYSPHFPNIYPNNINCHWSVTLAAGYRIKLFFPVMDLEDRNGLSDECAYDSVAVYDGDTQADALLGRWCGRDQPPFLVSKGNKLLVVLSTDRNEAHRGFTASYLGGKFLTSAGPGEHLPGRPNLCSSVDGHLIQDPRSVCQLWYCRPGD
uniref:CUB domain-containing protein n=1 Tax=Gasterosteus aculeatus aculeatus TaxID=481459 RepID=A0AAQ4PKQ5_GASAC